MSGDDGVGKGVAAVTIGTDIAKGQDNNWPRALRFGTACATVVILCPDGSSATLTNVQSGETIDCSVRKVISATGTPTDIVAYF